MTTAITTADARVLLLHVTDDAPIAEDNVHYAYLDVNGDGTVNKDDVDVITAYCAELEVSTASDGECRHFRHGSARERHRSGWRVRHL